MSGHSNSNLRKSTLLQRHGTTLSPLAHKRRRVEHEASAVVDAATPAPLMPGPKGMCFDSTFSLPSRPSQAGGISMTDAGANFTLPPPPPPAARPLPPPTASPFFMSNPTSPSGTPAPNVSGLELSPARLEAESHGAPLLPPPLASPLFVPSHASPSGTPAPNMSGLELSLARLEAESHGVRLQQARQVQGNSQTAGTYERHIKNYETWWTRDQQLRSQMESEYTPIPAFPVTAAKVAMFLQYETTREKVWFLFSPLFFLFICELFHCQRARGSRTVTVPNSTIGKSMVSQAISALENWRLNHHHLYKDIIEAQIGLRSDNRIKTIEDAAKKNEPRRIETSQVLKASGTSSGR
jgi:hypothetical protein